MNKLKHEEKILRGFFWCPAKLKPILEERLDDIKSRRNINGPQIHHITNFDEESNPRPTYIETNEVTWAF